MRRLLLCVLFGGSACGGGSISAIDAIVADTTHDSGGDPNEGARSGSRLKLQWFMFADGTRQIGGLYDAQRKEACGLYANWLDATCTARRHMAARSSTRMRAVRPRSPRSITIPRASSRHRLVQITTGPSSCGSPVVPKYATKSITPPPGSCAYTREMHLITAPDTGPIYTSYGVCQLLTPSTTVRMYSVGPALPLTDFESGSLQTDL